MYPYWTIYLREKVQNKVLLDLSSNTLNSLSHVLRVMGLKSRNYWLSNLILDFMLFAILCPVMVFMTSKTWYIDFKTHDFWQTTGIFVGYYMVFAFSQLTLNYNLSITFSWKTCWIINFGVLFIGFICLVIL